MGWRLLRRIERRARVTDNYEKETEEVYELDSAEDFNAFLVAFKRRGGVVVERRGGLVFYFTIESIAIERRPPMASGKLQATATLTMALTTRGPTLVAPWELPPTAYRVSTTTLEEPASRFYPGVGRRPAPNEYCGNKARRALDPRPLAPRIFIQRARLDLRRAALLVRPG